MSLPIAERPSGNDSNPSSVTRVACSPCDRSRMAMPGLVPGSTIDMFRSPEWGRELHQEDCRSKTLNMLLRCDFSCHTIDFDVTCTRTAERTLSASRSSMQRCSRCFSMLIQHVSHPVSPFVLFFKICLMACFCFLWSAPVAFRRVALETPEWTSRDSNHHRQSVSAGKTNAIPTEPSGRLV